MNVWRCLFLFNYCLNTLFLRYLLLVSSFCIVVFTLSGQVVNYQTTGPCGYGVTLHFENIPFNEDAYDGNVDGKETHYILPNISYNGIEDRLQSNFLKIDKIEEICNDLDYSVLYQEEFNGIEINLNKWTTSPHGDPYAWGPTQAPVWFHPDFVQVDQGLLKIKIEGMFINDNNLNYPTVYSWSENNEVYTQSRYSLAGWVMTDTPSSPESGCLRYGRYSIKAKLPDPSVGEAWSAFWFYGYAGEIDHFEYCLNDCDKMKFSYHAWSALNCEDTNYRHYRDYLWNVPDCDPYSNHVLYNKEGDFPYDPFNSFNIYTLEWTPYKIVWYINGEEVYQFYRYYRINCNSILPSPLECSDIDKGVPLDDVYEVKTWNRLKEQRMDLILNGTHGGTIRPYINEEFIIDWVKFEHRVGDIGMIGESTICDNLNNSFTYELNWGNLTPTTVDWVVSDNLNIVSYDNNSITITPTTFGKATITAKVPYEYNCLGAEISKEITISKKPELAPFFINFEEDVKNCCYNLRAVYSSSELYEEFIWKVNGIEYVSETPILPFPCFTGSRYLAVSVYGRNSCGQTNPFFRFIILPEINHLNCIGSNKKYKLHVTPNPTNSFIDVSIMKNTDITEWSIDNVVDSDIEVFNELTQMNNSEYLLISLRNSANIEIASETLIDGQLSTQFNLTGLISGEYYISTLVGSEIITQTVIKH
ncbi:MAG: family 16 glycosylhydrolase [Saprospiraceae bacterium]